MRITLNFNDNKCICGQKLSLTFSPLFDFVWVARYGREGNLQLASCMTVRLLQVG